jgi:hypothetical protein
MQRWRELCQKIISALPLSEHWSNDDFSTSELIIIFNSESMMIC